MDLKIKVYGRPDCQPCKATIRAIAKHDLEFEYFDLSTDKEAEQYCMSRGVRSLPYCEAGDQHWTGFRPDLISALASQNE